MSDHVFFCVEDLLPPNMTLCATYARTITTMIGNAALLKNRFTYPARRGGMAGKTRRKRGRILARGFSSALPRPSVSAA